MFTGIISKTAKVKNIKNENGGFSLEILNSLGKIKLGESISVNGVCSTVKKTGRSISFEYIPETLRLTNVGSLKVGEVVNLERSMLSTSRLDGHIVLGHVDGRGEIFSVKKEGNSKVFKIKLPEKKYKKLLVYKGSITIEGISLTVAKVEKDFFVVKIIPYTLAHTNLKFKESGDVVNLEFDILAKYIYANKK